MKTRVMCNALAWLNNKHTTNKKKKAWLKNSKDWKSTDYKTSPKANTILNTFLFPLFSYLYIKVVTNINALLLFFVN